MQQFAYEGEIAPSRHRTELLALNLDAVDQLYEAESSHVMRSVLLSVHERHCKQLLLHEMA